MWEWLLAHPDHPAGGPGPAPEPAELPPPPAHVVTDPAQICGDRSPVPHPSLKESTTQGMHSTADEVDLRLRVDRRTTGAEGVVVLDLRAADGTDLPAWAPGAHVDLRLPGGLTRQYSLCGDPADRPCWRVAVLREPDEPRRLGVRARRSWPRARRRRARPAQPLPARPAPRYLFIAGGIGITPILPMIGAAEARGRRVGAARTAGESRASMAFLESLERHGSGSTLTRRTRSGCSTSTRLLGTPRRTPWSTAAARAAAGRGRAARAGTGRRVPCTSSGSRPRTSASRC